MLRAPVRGVRAEFFLGFTPGARGVMILGIAP